MSSRRQQERAAGNRSSSAGSLTAWAASDEMLMGDPTAGLPIISRRISDGNRYIWRGMFLGN